MRRRSKKRMSQLLKGLFIGLFLLFAIITTTNFLDKGKNKYVSSSQESQETKIPTPTINIVSEKSKASNNKITQSNSDSPDDTDANIDSANEETTATNDTYQPTLEGEQTAEDIAAKNKAEQESNISYGFLKATAINPKNKQTLKVNFTIFNDKNIKVIEGTSTNNPSFKLPTGRYRVVATLLNLNNKKTNAESSETIIIREDEITRKMFKVSPPITIGVLQVSAINANNQQSLRANFTVQKENGETVATRQNVSNTLFKLDSGSYKVTVTSGQNSDSRTIVVDAGGATKEVFKLQEASKQGKLMVKALEGRSDNKVAVNIKISDENDVVIHQFNDLSQTEIMLPVGNYSISVATSYARANKNIHITAGRTLNEIFRFDPPTPSIETLAKKEPSAVQNQAPTAGQQISTNTNALPTTEEQTTQPNAEQKANTEDPTKKENTDNKIVVNTGDTDTAIDEKAKTKATTPTEVMITDDVKITAVDTTKINNDLTRVEKTEKAKSLRGSIKIIAKNSSDSSPIKSNFYIQTLSGKHIVKKIYADDAKFELDPGTYKVTVRANKRNNMVKTIEIHPNKLVTTTFLLEKSGSKNTHTSTQKKSTPSPQRQTNNTNGTGFLRINMRPSGNMQANDNRLNSHFVVYKKSGEKIVELTNVKHANFKLDVGEYKVSAINNRSVKSHTINIRASQVANISFNLADFGQSTRRSTPSKQTPQTSPQRQQSASNIILKGGLRSHIVNQAGQHLKGNLTVRDKLGRVVARANNVSVGVFNLPPARYTIVLEYQGLRGSEKVNIITGETTVQTFTLAQ